MPFCNEYLSLPLNSALCGFPFQVPSNALCPKAEIAPRTKSTRHSLFTPVRRFCSPCTLESPTMLLKNVIPSEVESEAKQGFNEVEEPCVFPDTCGACPELVEG